MKSLFVLASLAVSSLAQATVAQIENGIAPALTKFVTMVQAMPISNANFSQVLAIDFSVKDFISTLDNTTSGLNSNPSQFSDNDASTILGLYAALEPNIQQFVTDLIARKNTMDALAGATALVSQDIVHLNVSTAAIGNEVVAHCPPDVIASCLAAQGSFVATITPLLATFS